MRTLTRRLSMVLLMGLFASLLGGCGSSFNSEKFLKGVDAALGNVPGVVSTSNNYYNTAGMSTSISIRITAATGADLEKVMAESLHAFAGASADADATTSVAYYVFNEGAEKTGIRPTAVGLAVTPTVGQIRQYADAK